MSTSPRRPVRSPIVVAVVLGMLGIPALPVAAQSGSASTTSSDIAVTAINDQDPSAGPATVAADGDLRIRGTTDLPSGQTDTSVIADAGDSQHVEVGAPVHLSGIAYRGVGDFTFDWSVEGTTDAFDDHTSPNPTLDTSGFAPGNVPVTLTVTDQHDGTTSTDTVLISLHAGAQQDAVLLDEEGTLDGGDLGTGAAPGTTAAHPFEVPPGTTDLNLVLDWTDPTGQALTDVDLYVDDPSDKEDGNTSGASINKPEVIAVAEPASGSWVAEVQGYLSGPTEYTLDVTADLVPADPLPSVSTRGPFDFAPNAEQVLTATASGGTEPLTLEWDLDLDGVADATGTSVTTDFGPGQHMVQFKATDATGFEVREVTAVRVTNDPAGTPGVVVVAVSDTGINPYHVDFRASTYADDAVLELTDGFTKHPSEYLTGYPTDAQALDLTLGGTYFPPEDQAAINGIQFNQLYWIPGTKIVGARDSNGSTGATSAPDTTKLLDDDSHGTRSASVATGNLYGFCPSCLLAVGEGFDNDAYFNIQPWVDITSNSFGAAGNVGFGGLLPAAQPRASAEGGQIAMYASGNGNENAFVTPQQTYLPDTLGPDWQVRVGAAVRSSRKPIVGDGTPVDVSSWGSGNIPAANPGTISGTGNHSGTSAATPYSAGALGDLLRRIRVDLGDGTNGWADGIVADGSPIASTPYLADGALSRKELLEAFFKTTEHDTSGTTTIYPFTTPDNPFQYAVGGYGIAEPASSQRAYEVLTGARALPDRTDADAFYREYDEPIRDFLWGDYSSDADPDTGGETQLDVTDTAGLAAALEGDFADTLTWLTDNVGPLPTVATSTGDGGVSETPFATFTQPEDGTTVNPADVPDLFVAGDYGLPSPTAAVEVVRHYPRSDHCTTDEAAGQQENNRLTRVDGVDGPGDDCGYNPLAFPIDQLLPIVDSYPLVAEELPITLGAGTVSGTFYVNYDTPSPVTTLTFALRTPTETIASQTVTVENTAASATNVPFEFSFEVPEPFVGRELNALAFEVDYEQAEGQITYSLDDETSYVDIPVAGPTPDAGQVEFAVDGGAWVPIPAANGTFQTTVDTTALADGDHSLAVRATGPFGETEPDTLTVTVDRTHTAPPPTYAVEVAVVPAGTQPTGDDWVAATSASPSGDLSSWTHSDAAPEQGSYEVASRLLENGEEIARATAAFEVPSASSTRDGSPVGPTWASSADSGLLGNDFGRFVEASTNPDRDRDAPVAINAPDQVYVAGTAYKPRAAEDLGVRDRDVLIAAYDTETGAANWTTRHDDTLADQELVDFALDGNNNVVYATIDTDTGTRFEKFSARTGEQVTGVAPGFDVDGTTYDSALSWPGGTVAFAGTRGGEFWVAIHPTGIQDPDRILSETVVPGAALSADIERAFTSRRHLLVSGHSGGDIYTAGYDHGNPGAHRVWGGSWAGPDGGNDVGVATEIGYVDGTGWVGFVAGKTFKPGDASQGIQGEWDIVTLAYALDGEAAGDLLWEHVFEGEAVRDDVPVDLAYNRSANALYVVGTSERGIPHGQDVVVLGYDADDGSHWATEYLSGDSANADDTPTDVEVSPDGERVFVAAEIVDVSARGGDRAGVFAFDAGLHAIGHSLVTDTGNSRERAGALAFTHGAADPVMSSSIQNLGTEYDQGAQRYPLDEFDILPVATILEFTSEVPAEVEAGAELPVEVQLTEADGRPVRDADISIGLGSSSTTFITDDGGVARGTITAPDETGDTELSASFAGDDPLQPIRIFRDVTVTVPETNTAPVAAFTHTPAEPRPTETITFDASGSTDEDGDALTYTWDLGDGTTATGRTVDHAYDALGDHTVILTVDDGTDRAAATTTVSVVPNEAPTAVAESDADKPRRHREVHFHGALSSDPEGDELTYHWDFGDGTTAEGKRVRNIYTKPGWYTVTLTVDDGFGGTDTDSIEIHVFGGPPR